MNAHQTQPLRSRTPLAQRLLAGMALVLVCNAAWLPVLAQEDRLGPEAGDVRLQPFDRMMERFLARHQVSAAALAVTDQGRLVYARGFGVADAEDAVPVTPSSLFRVASVSKPITATAILRLVEREALGLDDRVARVLAWEAPGTVERITDARLFDVTVRHLLQHRGGWDRETSFDPMFRSVEFARQCGVAPPAQADHVIRCMLERPLEFAPGERYAYSNFGYCLLGRVIEAVSGEPYETHVRRHVLAPMGIRQMRLGRTHPQHRRVPGEVRYFDPGTGPSVFAADLGQTVPQPYGCWCLEAMDAHGGWLASVLDLARFSAAFDATAGHPVLRRKSIECMLERPPGAAGRDDQGDLKPWYYGMGWLVRPQADGSRNTWHNGSLPGTAAILIRRHDGRNFVALMNTRVSEHSQHLEREIDPLLHRAADAVAEWPEHDLFERLQ
jgi:N-acyl-D-amino-acid deacylase